MMIKSKIVDLLVLHPLVSSSVGCFGTDLVRSIRNLGSDSITYNNWTFKYFINYHIHTTNFDYIVYKT
jgi:hypothetical protein